MGADDNAAIGVDFARLYGQRIFARSAEGEGVDLEAEGGEALKKVLVSQLIAGLEFVARADGVAAAVEVHCFFTGELLYGEDQRVDIGGADDVGDDGVLGGEGEAEEKEGEEYEVLGDGGGALHIDFFVVNVGILGCLFFFALVFFCEFSFVDGVFEVGKVEVFDVNKNSSI